MKLSDLLRSIGGVLIIAVGAIVAAFVGKYTQTWVFIPAFIGFELVAFGIYYWTVIRK